MVRRVKASGEQKHPAKQPSSSNIPGNRRITNFFRYCPNFITPAPSPDHSLVSAGMNSSETSISALPSRLFATDRYPDARLNIYSKPDILCFIRKHLKGTPEFRTLKKSCFGQLFSIPVNRSPISCKLIHALLCRQLVTKKKYEFWSVFGGKPMRFSLPDFGAVTGLPCGEFPDWYDPEDNPNPAEEEHYFFDDFVPNRTCTLADLGDELVSSTDGTRRLMIALILIVDGVLIAQHQVHRPTFKYVQMLENLDDFLSFPWGRESFLKTIAGMLPGPKITGKGDEHIKTFVHQLQQKTIRINGFPLALQLIALQNIPGLLHIFPGGSDTRSFLKWSFIHLPRLNCLQLTEVHRVERDPNLSVEPYYVSESSTLPGSGEWDDEVRDKRVDYMIDLINLGHNFTKTEWLGGDDSLPIIVVPVKKPTVVHRKHLVLRKRKSSERTPDVVEPEPSCSRGKRRKVDADDASPSTTALKDWMDTRLNCLKEEYDLKLQELAARFTRLEKRFKASRTRHSRRLSTRQVHRSSKKKPSSPSHPFQNSSNLSPRAIFQNQSTPVCSPRQSVHNSILTPPDILKGGHDWSQYTNGLEDDDVVPPGHQSMDNETRPTHDGPSIPVDIAADCVKDSSGNLHSQAPLDTTLDLEVDIHCPQGHVKQQNDTVEKSSASIHDPPVCNPHGHPRMDTDSELLVDDNDNPCGQGTMDSQQVTDIREGNLCSGFAPEVEVTDNPQVHGLVQTGQHSYFTEDDVFIPNPLGGFYAVSPNRLCTSRLSGEPIFDTATKTDTKSKATTPDIPDVNAKLDVNFSPSPVYDTEQKTSPSAAFVLNDNIEHASTAPRSIPLPNAPVTTTEVMPVNDNQDPPAAEPVSKRLVGITTSEDTLTDEDRHEVDIDSVDVSDSSPARAHKNGVLSDDEKKLVTMFLTKPTRIATDLLHQPDAKDLSFFRNTLANYPKTSYLTPSGDAIGNEFLATLAEPQNWVTHTHMAFLMSFLSKRHSATLIKERSMFLEPWFANALQGKYRTFHAAVNKLRIRWPDNIKRTISTPGAEWFEDVDNIYVPMIWEGRHWVGLVIHLGLWMVDIYDPNSILYTPKKVEEVMKPVTLMLPYIIRKFCKPQPSQINGLTPFIINRKEGIYTNVRSGDCGPLAAKLLEMHLNSSPIEDMANIDDKIVDGLRGQYAMDIYHEVVAPMYGPQE